MSSLPKPCVKSNLDEQTETEGVHGTTNDYLTLPFFTST